MAGLSAAGLYPGGYATVPAAWNRYTGFSYSSPTGDPPGYGGTGYSARTARYNRFALVDFGFTAASTIDSAPSRPASATDCAADGPTTCPNSRYIALHPSRDARARWACCSSATGHLIRYDVSALDAARARRGGGYIGR